jgi:glucosamine 6-phosphate synthetase-like amidotransferase/phosphosugar isomerase protein
MTQEPTGSYASLATFASKLDKILAAKRDAPLIIGLGDDANIGSEKFGNCSEWPELMYFNFEIKSMVQQIIAL